MAIIGAGGIGFNVAEFLVQDGDSPTLHLDEWLSEWGVVDPAEARGGIDLNRKRPEPSAREVTLLQRKSGKHGARLGKTTGWIHRATLKMNNVQMIGGADVATELDAKRAIDQGSRLATRL